MADNVTLNSMSGGSAVGADDISSVFYQRIKLIHGADGVNDGDVSTANPFPVREYFGTVAVAVGAGAVSTGVQRVTSASDDPAVTHLATIAGDTTDIEAAVEIMDDWDNTASDGASVSGDVAHDGADAGEPVKLGHKAIAHGANPTAVAAADRTNWYANRHGIPFVIGGHMNAIQASINVTDADGAQTDAAIITVSAGTIIVVTMVVLTAEKANTDAGGRQVRVGFGSANTPAVDAAGILLHHPNVAPGGGAVVGNGGGIVGIGGDGIDVRITCADPTGGSLTVNVHYFTIES